MHEHSKLRPPPLAGGRTRLETRKECPPTTPGPRSVNMKKELRKHLPEGKFQRVSAVRSAAMRAVRSRGNKTTEQRLRFGLVRAGLRGWSIHVTDVPGTPDFFFAEEKLAVFVDGCFWHGCPKCGHLPKSHSGFWEAKIEGNARRDKAVSRELRRAGFRVMRFWEHELSQDLTKCIARIVKLVNARSG